jgi:hypothetical protein
MLLVENAALVAEPPETGTAAPKFVPSTVNWTDPSGVPTPDWDEVTSAVNVTGSLISTLGAEVETEVTVPTLPMLNGEDVSAASAVDDPA